jgi:hypothetical protein
MGQAACCTSREGVGGSSAPVTYEHHGLTDAVEGLPPLEKWWEPYMAQKNEVAKISEWTMKQQHWCNAFCGEADNAGDQPRGVLSWDKGEIRDVVRLFFTKVGKLSAPRMSQKVWHALWIEVERNNKDSVQYSTALEFTRYVVRSLYDILTGKKKPVEIAKGVWIAGTPTPAPADHGEKAKYDWHADYKKQIPQISQIVDDWDEEHVTNTVNEIFNKSDADIDGCLRWSNSEVRTFINNVFVKHGIPVPPLSETQWYELYREFEKNNDLRLSRDEASNFAKYLHTQIANKTADWEHLKLGAPILVKNANGTYTPVPVDSTGAANGAAPANGSAKANGSAAPAEPVVNPEAVTKATFHAASEDWRQFAEPKHEDIAQQKVDQWHGAELQQTVHELFGEVDANGDGHLEWNNSEIRRFVKDVFQHLGLPVPAIPEMVWYRMYREVDVDGDYTLTEPEAAVLIKHILTRIVHLNEK